MCCDDLTASCQASDCASEPPHTVLADETPTAELSTNRPRLTNTSVAALAPTRGRILRSRYVLQEIIGGGGTSIVFRAQDLLRGHAVAVKLLPEHGRSDPSRLRRLQYEFLKLQSLSHPGIVRVFEFDRDGDVWFISMELVAGLTVKSWLATPRSYPHALKLVASCCSALEYAHSVGVLHGDVKPTNVMVSPDGTARLIDFGSASTPGTESSAGSQPMLPATPCFASPQILAGGCPEQRDDIYSLACLTYSVLSGGRHPFGGRPSFERGRAKCSPTYVRAIPPELFEVIERSLSADRERRAASAGEFLRAVLDADQRHRATSAPSAGTTNRHANGARRQPGRMLSVTDQVVARETGVRFSLANALAVALAIVGAVCMRLERQREPVAAPSKAAAGQILQASATVLQFPPGMGSQPLALPEIRFPSYSRELISFDAPTTMHVSAGQSLVAINVRRSLPAHERALFAWHLEGVVGSLHLDRQVLAPKTVAFNEGQARRTLFIPLTSGSDAGITRGGGSFSVVLQRVAGGPAVGRITRVQIVTDPSPRDPRVTIQARAAE